MNIVQISYNEKTGGAARIAHGLHTRCREIGHHSYMLVGHKESDDPDVIPISPLFNKNTLFSKLLRCTVLYLEQLIGIPYILRPSISITHPYISRADIIHVHNVHGGYINPSCIMLFASLKPTIWTQHDMWPLTGHCTHSFDCEKWKSGCGSCPYLKASPAIKWDNTKKIWRMKSEMWGKNPIYIICPSNWIKSKVLSGNLCHQKVLLIENFVDSALFRPYKDRKDLRNSIGLPVDVFTIMIAGYDIKNNPHKGYQYILELISKIKSKKQKLKIKIIVVGDKTVSPINENQMITYIPYTRDDNKLSLLYASADVYLMCSIAENAPLVVIESISCGTPVIAFAVGGISEIIEHKKTGYIVNPGLLDELIEGICYFYFMNKEKYQQIRTHCRNTVLKRFDKNEQVQKHIDLYQNAMNHKNSF